MCKFYIKKIVFEGEMRISMFKIALIFMYFLHRLTTDSLICMLLASCIVMRRNIVGLPDLPLGTCMQAFLILYRIAGRINCFRH